MIKTWAVRAAAAGLVAAVLGALYAHLRDLQRMMITDVMSAAFNDGVAFGKSTVLLQAALDEPPVNPDARLPCAVCGALVPALEALWQPDLGGWTHPFPGDTGGCE